MNRKVVIIKNERKNFRIWFCFRFDDFEIVWEAVLDERVVICDCVLEEGRKGGKG